MKGHVKGIRTLAVLAAIGFAAFGSVALGQSVPSGWSSQSESGYTVMIPPDVPSGQAFLVITSPKESRGGKSLESWTKAQAADAVKEFGTPIGQPKITNRGNYYEYTQAVTVQGTPMVMIIFGVDVGGGRGQLLVIMSTPDEDMMSRYVNATAQMIAQMAGGSSGSQASSSGGSGGSGGASRGGTRTTITSSSGNGSVTTSNSTSGTSSNAQKEPWRTAAGKGIPANQIEGIYYRWWQEYTVGGLQYEHEWVLLLKDGSAYRKLAIPPTDLNVTVSKRQQASSWTRWRRQGGAIQLQENGAWKTFDGKKVKPAAANQKLNGSYTSYAFANYGGLGGYSSKDTIILKSDGTFSRVDSFQQGTGVVQSLNDFSSSGASFGNDSGKYVLNGYTIELRYSGGAVERHLFFFDTDGKDFIMGTGLFMKDK